jgi:hypothetical protein
MTSGIAGGGRALALVCAAALALAGCGDSDGKGSTDGSSAGTGGAGAGGSGGGTGGGSGGASGAGGASGGDAAAGSDGPKAADTAGATGGSSGTDGATPADAPPKDVGGAGDVATGASSGLDPAKKLSALSDAELGQLCDWTAAKLGGYGAVKECPGGLTIRNKANRAACVSGTDRAAPACTATVGQAETCVQLQVQDICSLASLSNPACQALFGCSKL